MKNRNINLEYKKFIELLDFNRGKHNMIDVFRDFVMMFAIAIKNAVHYEQKYEDLYLKIEQKYSREEMEVIFQLINELIYLLLKRDTLRDVLGEIYQQIGANSNRIGQVFTPRHIAHAMTQMILNREPLNKKDYISIYDPTCGAGVMLIEAANVLNENNIDYKEKGLMIGQDLDFICVCMTYIQLSIYGIPAIVVYGNTLTQEIITTFYTPRFSIGKWYEKLRKKENKNEN